MIPTLAVVALLLAAGCSRSDSTRQPAPSGRPRASSTEPPARASSRYVGLYTLASPPDSGVLHLCSGGEARVLDRTGGDLRRAHEALGGPGQPVFVEVHAETIGPGAGTKDAPARLGVISLVRASPVGEGAGCSEAPARYRFRASGNEPFWSMTVGRDSVVFEQPDEPRRVAGLIVGAEADSSHYAVRARSGGASPHTIRLVLTTGRCADSMSGALTSFSAEATVDGRSLTGCGRAGDLPAFP